MDSEEPKMIDGAILRRKVHRMILRAEEDHMQTMWDKGFLYALTRVERMIDKLSEKKEEKNP